MEKTVEGQRQRRRRTVSRSGRRTRRDPFASRPSFLADMASACRYDYTVSLWPDSRCVNACSHACPQMSADVQSSLQKLDFRKLRFRFNFAGLDW